MDVWRRHQLPIEKEGREAKDIDSRPVAAEEEPNRSRSGDSCLFFSICLLLACSTKEKRRRRKDDGGIVGFISIDMRRLASVGYRHGITRIGSVWYGMVWYVTVLSPNRSWNSADSTEVEEN